MVLCILLQCHLPLLVDLLWSPLPLPYAQLCPTDRSLTCFQEKVSSVKPEGTLIVYMQPMAKLVTWLTLGLQFVMCGSLSCPSNFYYDYIQPESKCFGNNKKISVFRYNPTLSIGLKYLITPLLSLQSLHCLFSYRPVTAVNVWYKNFHLMKFTAWPVMDHTMNALSSFLVWR